MSKYRSWARRVAVGLSSLRDRAASRLAGSRFNPSRWLRRHHWLIVSAAFVAPFVAVDILTKFHGLAMFCTVIFLFQLADDRDTAER